MARITGTFSKTGWLAWVGFTAGVAASTPGAAASVAAAGVAASGVAAGGAGWSVDALQDRLRAQLEGQPIGLVIEPGRRIPLMLRGLDPVRESGDALAALQITAPDGQVWPLTRLARLTETEGPVRIDHENASLYKPPMVFFAHNLVPDLSHVAAVRHKGCK